MIDIETKNERDLKNIRQIGMPTQEDKIYIENAVYARIHEEDYAEKKVFVFMGHTECIQGRYTTFIEAGVCAKCATMEQSRVVRCVPRGETVV